MDSNEYVSEAAVEKVTDQNLLGEIAKTASNGYVRVAVVEKLSDQNLLAEIARTASDGDVREAAFKKLSDQNLLAKIAKTASDGDVRSAAVGKLRDQTVFSEIAKTDTDGDFRVAAVNELRDPTLLAEMAKTASDGDVRGAAVGKLTDQTLIAEIANTDGDDAVRIAAVKRLDRMAYLQAEVDSLLHVLETGTDKDRLEAGRRLTGMMWREAAQVVSSEALRGIVKLNLSIRQVRFESVMDKGVSVFVDTGNPDDHYVYYPPTEIYKEEIVTYESFSWLKQMAGDELKRRKDSGSS
jgi:uncharacterized DUF497 family protein